MQLCTLDVLGASSHPVSAGAKDVMVWKHAFPQSISDPV